MQHRVVCYQPRTGQATCKAAGQSGCAMRAPATVRGPRRHTPNARQAAATATTGPGLTAHDSICAHSLHQSRGRSRLSAPRASAQPHAAGHLGHPADSAVARLPVERCTQMDGFEGSFNVTRVTHGAAVVPDHAAAMAVVALHTRPTLSRLCSLSSVCRLMHMLHVGRGHDSDRLEHSFVQRVARRAAHGPKLIDTRYARHGGGEEGRQASEPCGGLWKA